MKLEFSRQIFKIYSNVNFYENPSGRSRDMTKVIVLIAIRRTRLKTDSTQKLSQTQDENTSDRGMRGT